MGGFDLCKLAFIGMSENHDVKSSTNINDLAINWYASRNVWMTGETHHMIMTKFNAFMHLCHLHTCTVHL